MAVILSNRFCTGYYPPTRHKSGEGVFSFGFIVGYSDILFTISLPTSSGGDSKMKTILLLVSALCFLNTSALAEQPVKGEVRDPSGKLLYKTTTRGSQTEVRNPSGKLLMKSKTSSDGTTDTRSPSGKLLYKSK